MSLISRVALWRLDPVGGRNGASGCDAALGRSGTAAFHGARGTGEMGAAIHAREISRAVAGGDGRMDAGRSELVRELQNWTEPRMSDRSLTVVTAAVTCIASAK